MLKKIFYSLPIQLLVLTFKRQHFYLFLWALLLGFITGNVGEKFGIKYLFLDPEYLGHVNILSFFMIGMCLGAFIMAYNIASYIIFGREIPFLASFKKPFLRFALNNALIPLLFVVWYSIEIIDFQIYNEESGVFNAITKLLGFYTGIFFFVLLSFAYFFNTNTDVIKMFGVKLKRNVKKAFLFQRRVLNRQFQWEGLASDRKELPILTFLDSDLKLKDVQYATDFEYKNLLSVLRQNHLNAILIQLIVLGLLILLGLLREFPVFQIPAGASVFIVFSMFIMLSGAFSFWLRGWGLTALLALVIVYNFASNYDRGQNRNKAYGLDYQVESADYSDSHLKTLVHTDTLSKDKEYFNEIFHNWKKKATAYTKAGKKPKLVLISVSGGGQRSALFTFSCLQYMDSVMNQKLLGQTFMFSGASGGLLGASYMRELMLQKALNDSISIYNKKYADNIAKDILNPIIFSIVVNDIFFPMQSYTYKGHKYTKDRGYAFEHTVNKNLEGILDKPLSAYTEYERKAIIPYLLFSPTIVNDGRKLYIASSPSSFIIDPIGGKPIESIDGIEFRRFFQNQSADSLRFLSAIRMNSNFPYMSPNTSLPSSPVMEVVDAGMRDNFGMEASLHLVMAFREWIKENTSGVVLLQIRDTPVMDQLETSTVENVISDIFKPFRGFYANWEKYQQFNQNNSFEDLKELNDFPMEHFVFQYQPESKSTKVSLSWHLTSLEKKNISKGITLENNQLEMKRLYDFLNTY